jgi:serine/threonine protein phosphatase PrpC
MTEEQDITAPFETEVLEAGWAVKSSARPRCYAYVVFGAKTDLGRVRENNEDKFDFFEPHEPSVLATKGRVFAVADGMGGHSAGQVASELSLNVFIRSFYSDRNPEIEKGLANAVREANAYVVDVARTVPGRSGMGATLTAAIIRDDDLYIAQVGDSRCYLLRGGTLEQITEDHSWVAEQVRAGTMSLEDAEQSPFRNVITRSMGGAPEVEPDVTAVKMQPGDRFMLCSDGLTGMVPDVEVAELLSQGSPSVAAWNLVDRANEYGGRDNITVFVLHIAEIQPWPEEDEPSASSSSSDPSDPSDQSEPAVEDSASSNGAEAGSKRGVVGRLFGRSV